MEVNTQDQDSKPFVFILFFFYCSTYILISQCRILCLPVLKDWFRSQTHTSGCTERSSDQAVRAGPPEETPQEEPGRDRAGVFPRCGRMRTELTPSRVRKWRYHIISPRGKPGFALHGGGRGLPVRGRPMGKRDGVVLANWKGGDGGRANEGAEAVRTATCGGAQCTCVGACAREAVGGGRVAVRVQWGRRGAAHAQRSVAQPCGRCRHFSSDPR